MHIKLVIFIILKLIFKATDGHFNYSLTCKYLFILNILIMHIKLVIFNNFIFKITDMN